MPNVTYVLADGSEHVVDVPCGQSVMDGSVRNNLPGIIAECGGSCSCATCHVHVDERWFDTFVEPVSEEEDLIEFSDDPQPTSRLSCQLIIEEQHEGLRVMVPQS